jgi:hypothetical protein
VVSGATAIDSSGNNSSIQDVWAPGAIGLQRIGTRSGAASIAGVVGNRPSWVIQQNLIVRDLDSPPGEDVVAVASFSPGSNSSIGGTLVSTPGDGAQLVISAFDTLVVGDVTGRIDGGSLKPALLEVWLAPFAGEAISAMAFFPLDDAGQVLGPDGGAAWARGYVLTQGGVAEVIADNALDWKATPVSIPAGSPVSLWGAHGRYRVGMSDGTVYSLPSLVALSPPVPENPPSATSFAPLCGQVFALGANALYRLDLIPDAGTGQWVSASVDGGPLFPDGADLIGAGLHALDQQLWLANRYGGVLRLDPASGACP